ncbi:MAG: 50S ribosomal protein L29 [Clostridia bacterium]|jgi:large subunit ribosomal protein L29|nr:50S ribosomal protein L29 [Clostridia bacterium]MBO7360196.1 50S ribosomal protein L29 [Clostridia bacterium]MCR4682695.1 50S ribosomal protein L29 [Clostridiales bacterium]
MKITEVRAMSDAELGAKLRELKEELFNLRFQLAVNQLENTNRIVEVKRDIARVMTVINEKKA